MCVRVPVPPRAPSFPPSPVHRLADVIAQYGLSMTTLMPTATESFFGRPFHDYILPPEDLLATEACVLTVGAMWEVAQVVWVVHWA